MKTRLPEATLSSGASSNKPRIVPLDLRQVMGEVAGKTVEPRIAAELGEARQRLSLEWKALRLLVGDHLQPMLDATEVTHRPG